MSSKLKKELAKKREFESLQQEVVLNILRTNDYCQYNFKKFFRQYGLSQQRFNILWILGDEGGPLPSQELGGRMITNVPAITSLTDKLTKRGLVNRTRCENDRRVCYVELTPEGEKLLAEIGPSNLENHHNLVGHLSEKGSRQLIELLEKARGPRS